MATIKEIQQINDENTKKILLIRQRNLEYKRRQARQEEKSGHPWINWAIAHLNRLNRWLMKKGWT